MPHKVIPIAGITTTTEAVAESIVPGTEPGGSRAGQATKPALLLRDVRFVPTTVAPNTAAVGQESAVLFLKMSQELDMTPGLQLPIASWFSQTQTAVAMVRMEFKDEFMAHGTIWAPRFIGVRAVMGGGWSSLAGDIHIDYDRVDVPWMDWFIMWEFLDGIADNEVEY